MLIMLERDKGKGKGKYSIKAEAQHKQNIQKKMRQEYDELLNSTSIPLKLKNKNSSFSHIFKQSVWKTLLKKKSFVLLNFESILTF